MSASGSVGNSPYKSTAYKLLSRPCHTAKAGITWQLKRRSRTQSSDLGLQVASGIAALAALRIPRIRVEWR